jgi:hypothetical protein
MGCVWKQLVCWRQPALARYNWLSQTGGMPETTDMRSQTEDFSPCRARLLTLVVLAVVAIGIALANMYSEPLTAEDFEKIVTAKAATERAYGWPLTWYWRTCTQSPPSTTSPYQEYQWLVSQSSAKMLFANLAVWLLLLAVTFIACRMLPRRYRPAVHCRLRLTTCFVVLFLLAPMVLANLSSEVSSTTVAPPPTGVPPAMVSPFSPPVSVEEFSYGWPLIWYRCFECTVWTTDHQVWDYNAMLLGANLAIWLMMLAVAALAWQWLLRRYPPGLRWSLRTMLIAIGAAAVICGWCANVLHQVREQDEVIPLIGEDLLRFEDTGPKWFEVVGLDRYARRMVGANMTVRDSHYREEQNEQILLHLSRLRGLRFLSLNLNTDIAPRVFNAAMADTLGTMRQLRRLDVNCRVQRHIVWNADGTQTWEKGPSPGVQAVAHSCLAAVGKLTELERLRVSLWNESSPELESLAGLTNLKSLTLDIESYHNRKGDGETRGLAHLPALPRLEELNLHGADVTDGDLRQLARFPRLRLLNLSETAVSSIGLADLALLESLEELAIDQDLATATAFEALIAVTHLRAIHIGNAQRYYDQLKGLAPLTLDDGYPWGVASSDVDGLRRALDALRKSHPDLVIDSKYHDFEERFAVEPAD